MRSHVIEDAFTQLIALERVNLAAGLRWRIGHAAFDALVEEVLPPAFPYELVRDFEVFDDLAARAERDRRARRSELLALWGKEGTQLLTYPVLCDDQIEGLRAEWLT